MHIRGTGNYRYKLPSYLTVFHSEFYALYRALILTSHFNFTKTLIFTDSHSSLQHILTSPPVDTLHRDFIVLYHELLQRGSTCVLVWIPSHSGIIGNEEVDREAKKALNEDDTHVYPLDKTVIKNAIDTALKHTLTRVHHQHPPSNHLNEVSNSINSLPPLPKQLCRALTRIQLGHTRLTHEYLIEHTAQPVCQRCRQPLTIQHIIESCPIFTAQRSPILHLCAREGVPPTIHTIINSTNNHLISVLINFLHSTNILNTI